MRQLVFLLEERSAETFIRGLLPRLLGPQFSTHLDVQYIVFEGKQDMQKRAGRIIHCWQRTDSVFLLLVDQDAGDCREVKQRFVEAVAPDNRFRVSVRVACRELEAWALGDWAAVGDAYGTNVHGLAKKAKFRRPDALANPCMELRRHVPGYQKVSGARLLGPLLDPDRSTSHSFRAFCSVLRRLVAGE